MSKEDAVDAVREGDRSRLIELNNPGLDQVWEIDQKIAAIGDREWIDPQSTWLENPVTGSLDAVRITATDARDNKLSDQVTVSLIDDSWYVNLGTRTPRTGDPQPASMA